MQTDNLSRGLLAAILICLVFLVVEHRGAGPGAAIAPTAKVKRFEVRPVVMHRGPPLLLRTDTATGQAWTMGLMDAPAWTPLAEGEAGVPEPDANRPGRFSIRPYRQTRGVPTLVRYDSLTGRVWRKGSRSKRAWVAVPNPEAASGATAAAPPAGASQQDLEQSEAAAAVTGSATSDLLEELPGSDLTEGADPDGD